MKMWNNWNCSWEPGSKIYSARKYRDIFQLGIFDTRTCKHARINWRFNKRNKIYNTWRGKKVDIGRRQLIEIRFTRGAQKTESLTDAIFSSSIVALTRKNNERYRTTGLGPFGNTSLGQQQSISQPATCQYMNMTSSQPTTPLEGAPLLPLITQMYESVFRYHFIYWPKTSCSSIASSMSIYLLSWQLFILTDTKSWLVWYRYHSWK